MISWLSAIILAYLFFALSSFGDKVILSGPPNPRAYTFYSGILSGLAVFLIPFFGLKFPGAGLFFWIIVDAAVFVFGLYRGFCAVEDFEVSKVSATIGAAQPVMIFFISWLFFGYQALSPVDFFAFLLLLLGGIFISFEKRPELTVKYLKATSIAAFLFALDYVLLKFIFVGSSFAQGFIWTRIFISIFAMALLLSKKNRKEIFKKNYTQNKNLRKTFFATQTCGGIAGILQSFAIWLAPAAFLPVANSLKGMQYVFLFAITMFFSFFFPKVLKESHSKKIIIQKIISIAVIGAGLFLLII